MKIKREFTNSFLVDGLGLPYDEFEGCTLISDNIVDTSRWSINHELVFKFEDKLYMTWYSVGATEQQDEIPWEYDDVVDCFEVIEVERVVRDYTYKEVEENGS